MIQLNVINEKLKTLDGSRVAIRDDNNNISWDRFQTEVEKYCDFVIKNNIKRCCLLLENSAKSVFIISALSTLRIPYLILDPSLSTKELFELISNFKASELINGFDKRHNKLNLENTKLRAFELNQFENNKNKCSINKIYSIAKLREIQSYSLTSGTSGTPKIVFRNTSFDKQRFEYFTHIFKLDSNDSLLCGSPIHHASCIGWARLILNLGGSIHLTKLENENFYQSLKNDKVTCATFSTINLDNVTQYFATNNSKIVQKLKFVLFGGKNLAPKSKTLAYSLFGEALCEYYGTTESGVNCLIKGTDILKYQRSVGSILPGNEIIFLDEENRLCNPKIGGRIAISSYQVMHSYFNSSINSIIKIDNRDYFLTPDYGRIENERLALLSRDAINCSTDVYEIENKIKSLSTVKDAFVTMNKNMLSIFIQLVSTESNFNTEFKNIFAELAQSIIPNEQKYELKIVNNIPYSLSGKVRVRELNQI